MDRFDELRWRWRMLVLDLLVFVAERVEYQNRSPVSEGRWVKLRDEVNALRKEVAR